MFQPLQTPPDITLRHVCEWIMDSHIQALLLNKVKEDVDHCQRNEIFIKIVERPISFIAGEV